MSISVRGPTGAAPFPPADLHERDLPITAFTPGRALYRVHRRHLDPVFFGPTPGGPPTYRFDPDSGRFGVLYAAPGRDAAMIETLLRTPQRLTVSYGDIETRSLSVLTSASLLRLVDATGANLSRLGTTAALATGPYEPCATWADALYDHRDCPDGILYASRHNPAETCIALFERAGMVLSVEKTTPLATLPGDIGALLDRHGKSLFGLS